VTDPDGPDDAGPMTDPDGPDDVGPLTDLHRPADDGPMADPDFDEGRRDGAGARRWTAGRMLAAAVVAASFVFWVWAFTPWARRENPARIDDRGFAAAADARCADLQAFIATLPSARSETALRQRADQVRTGTEAVEGLVADLRASASGLSTVTDSNGPPDSELVASWLEDWGVYVADRRTYETSLEEAAASPEGGGDGAGSDTDLRFLLSDAAPVGVYTERMDGFARLNGMDNCQIPGDV